jgi:hypothetical protein
MVSFPTYMHALGVSLAAVVVFAIVSDLAGMDKADRLAILRLLWAVPALIACAAVVCGALILLGA